MVSTRLWRVREPASLSPLGKSGASLLGSAVGSHLPNPQPPRHPSPFWASPREGSSCVPICFALLLPVSHHARPRSNRAGKARKQTLSRTLTHTQSLVQRNCLAPPDLPCEPAGRLWGRLVEEPAEEREHARLPVSDLKGVMGEQDFIQLEVVEKWSEHEASFFQVGQTLEGRRSCPLDGRRTRLRKQLEMKWLLNGKLQESQQHCSGFSPCRLRLHDFSPWKCVLTGCCAFERLCR